MEAVIRHSHGIRFVAPEFHVKAFNWSVYMREPRDAHENLLALTPTEPGIDVTNPPIPSPAFGNGYC
jgi:hypothetical protein